MEDLEQILENAEPADEGVTNEVYFTDRGTVVKIFPKYPGSSILNSITTVFEGLPYYVTRDIRMRNERKMKEVIREIGYSAPEVVTEGEDFMEFEKVEGEDGFNFLTNCTESEAEDLGKMLGDFSSKLHRKGSVIKDFKVSNVSVSEGEIHFIDHEYSVINANKVVRLFDQLTLFSSVRQTGKFKPFLDGYKKSDKKLSRLALILSVFTALEDSLIMERNLKRFKTALKTSLAW